VNELEFGMLNQILDIYENRPINVPSIKEIEKSDAVLVLGEDLTNTAARIALALRQSVKNLGKEMAAELNLPQWQDAAIRQLAMDQLSPLFILSPHVTRLDDVAKQVHISSADQSAKIGFAIANAIDSSAPAVDGLSNEEQALASTIAEALKSAKQPLVISGTGSMSPALIEAAANIATALSNTESKANLALLSSESNSMGLALMMQDSNNTLNAAFMSPAKTAIVLENDLYRRAASIDVDTFIGELDQLVVLDSLQNSTGEKANLVLAAGTFAETSGSFINYETRAQHFYSVFLPAASIQPSCSWLSTGKSLNQLTQACSEEIANCAGMSHLTPGEDYNVAGLKAPRQHHRYSGRTSMRADISVHEPKQEQDENGVMVYSMEGVAPVKDASVLGSPWAPGWNSNQSIVKFQSDAGGALKQASQGECLVASQTFDKTWFEFSASKTSKDGFEVFPLYHLFGSEELSSRTPAIQEKATAAYIALSPTDAENLDLQASDGVQVENNGAVPFIIRDAIKPGTVGVSVGLTGLNFQNITDSIKLTKASVWQSPTHWKADNIIVSDRRPV
jgi:NADH-quinone oxidoreductase subunit G